MKTAQILFTRANTAELRSVTVPSPKGTEVLVKMSYTVISAGTEKANLIGEINIGIKNPPKTAQFPRYVGYSGSGVVEAVGKDVTRFKIGDHVATRWGIHQADKIFQEDHLILLDESVDMKLAAFSLISTFPMAAVRKIRVEIGEPAMVMGLGLLGQFAVMFLKAAGAVPVIAADPLEDRRRLAKKNGADYVVDPTRKGFDEKVRDLTRGGVKAAIEVTGLGIGLDETLDCMARFGRVALLGCTRHSDFSIDYYKKVHGPGITLIGAHTNARPVTESFAGWWTDQDDQQAYFDLLKYKRINVTPMIGEIHSPEEAPQVYARLAQSRQFPIGVLFDWNQLKKQ